MSRATMLVLVLAGCGQPDPNLLVHFGGEWSGDLVPDAGERRALEGSFAFDDASGVLSGELVVDDPDGARGYSIQSSESIGELGIALYFIETTGVRELWSEAEPPSEGFWSGPYRSVWGCTDGDPLYDEDGDGVCREEGTLQLTRLE